MMTTFVLNIFMLKLVCTLLTSFFVILILKLNFFISIKRINKKYISSFSNQKTVSIIIALNLLPFTDTLRVMSSRIISNLSPFLTVKNYLHHLIFYINNNHKKTTLQLITLHVSLLFTILFFDKLNLILMTFIQICMILGYQFYTALFFKMKKWNDWLVKLETN